MELYSDEYFMRKAIDEAKEAYREGEIPVGCVIVCKNQILASTHNLTENLTDVTAHAEIMAITAASNMLGGKYLTDCTLYVTVEPCIMCAGAIGWAQIGKIVFGAADPKRGYATFAPGALHPKAVVVSGVLEEKCSELMKMFFANKR